jgi:glucose-1-phosphatase
MIKNIIFDLGGVVINLDMHLTINAFRTLGFSNIEDFFSFSRQNEFFDQFETGKITAAVFREQIRKAAPKPIIDADIDYAWNAMILDLPAERIALIKKMKPKFRTFILSNTNEIHVDYFSAILRRNYGMDNFSEIFEKVYYSNEIGAKKPNAESFEFVLKENNLLPEETFFIDDTQINIEAASKLGIKSYWLKNGETINSLFDYGK